MLWRTCDVYTHLSAYRLRELQLLPNNSESETFFTQIGGGTRGWLGRRRGGNWANTWRWTKSIIVPATNCYPTENQVSIPFPEEGRLRCFCKNRWTDTSRPFCSQTWLFCEWTVSTFWRALIASNSKWPHTEVKTSRQVTNIYPVIKLNYCICLNLRRDFAHL
jgi:hypothetical protein